MEIELIKMDADGPEGSWLEHIERRMSAGSLEVGSILIECNNCQAQTLHRLQREHGYDVYLLDAYINYHFLNGRGIDVTHRFDDACRRPRLSDQHVLDPHDAPRLPLPKDERGSVEASSVGTRQPGQPLPPDETAHGGGAAAARRPADGPGVTTPGSWWCRARNPQPTTLKGPPYSDGGGVWRRSGCRCRRAMTSRQQSVAACNRLQPPGYVITSNYPFPYK